MPTDLAEIGHELRTQDNAITAHPIFLVEQLERIYWIDPYLSGELVWVSEDGGDASPQKQAALERYWEQHHQEPRGWRRTAYVERMRFVTACFTRKAAEAFIAANRHNLKEPRVFVASGHRNPEWQAVRNLLMEHGKTT
jgi:hypothetical protein